MASKDLVMKNNSGVYKITNMTNNKVYIGSSSNIKLRLYRHSRALSQNKHANKHLQAAYNLVGKENFIFVVLLYCDNKDLLFYEQRAIDMYKPEYNICTLAGSCLGIKHSNEAKAKITAAQLGRVVSEETRTKISLSHSGMKSTNEAKEKQALAKLGNTNAKGRHKTFTKRKHTEEAKLKMSISRKNYLAKKLIEVGNDR